MLKEPGGPAALEPYQLVAPVRWPQEICSQVDVCVLVEIELSGRGLGICSHLECREARFGHYLVPPSFYVGLGRGECHGGKHQ